MLENLKREVLKASLTLSKYGLVTYAGGAASACESRYGLVVINPSGVPFEDLKAERDKNQKESEKQLDTQAKQ